MKKAIVCTSINQPTKAILKFDAFEDWFLIVIGDLKTPSNYELKNGIYLSPQKQEEMDKELSDLIGWNCIQRRNFGMLWAYKNDFDLVAVVDDDNIPLDNWGKDVKVGVPTSVKQYLTSEIAFDPIGATNHNNLWHRGFPLELVPFRNYAEFNTIEFIPNIQANFWNGDPDIDAVCRMINRPECNFDEGIFPFTSNKLSPFNSQNTILNREALTDYFLFPHVGRMDDIWASYYVQALGHKVIYDVPTVYQDRNEHNLLVDMKKEYIGYENNVELLTDIKTDPNLMEKYLPEKSRNAWSRYRQLINS